MIKKNYKVSIVVPVYNENENINFFYNSFITFKKKSKYIQNYEILFIDDGSIDDSAEKIKSLVKKDRNVKIISFTRNFGVNFVFKAGLDHFKGDCMIFIDADLQYPFDVIDEFLKEWKSGNNIVFAKRLGYKEKKFLRLIGFIFIRIFNMISRVKLDFDTSYTCLLDNSVANILKNLKEKSKYYPALIRWLGFKIRYVTCKINKRALGESKIGFSSKSREAINAITNFTTAPLKILTLIGFIISIVAITLGLYILISSIIRGIEVPGYPSIFLSILFMGGLQLISIGILSEYISEIYEEEKARPDYIIKEKMGL